ncbi:MAG TPA: thioester reductase [Cyanothece sp. UBA12306]|nr:thioester reductase [Cyanothece sp. UBA12306]
MTQPEQHQLLEEWTNTQTDYPRNSTIHELFTFQAAQTPNAIAIAYKNQEITYRELDKRSNILANYLQKLGVKKETLVSLYLDRSPDLIISILAILKAGGAYLPLDTSTPLERTKTILKDSETSILITQKSYLNIVNNVNNNLNYIVIDEPFISVDLCDDNPLKVKVNGDNLAYVMYTSGSTGTPKGVCVVHRGVVRLVKNNNFANFTDNEVILQLASIAFDAATFEIWQSLLNGGKLVLMPVKTPSLQDIGKAIEQYNITTLWLTAGLFHLIVEEHIEYLKPLKKILAGGDTLSISQVKKVLEEVPHCQLINGYGPTENTTFTCCHTIRINDTNKKSIPIGRPIANTQVYLLDNNLQLVDIGLPGELYIAGDGLARGYLNRPQLTAEKFIKNPFSNESNSRLYKTGDLGCWNKDGTIEFLGRIDYQIKIRGYRVELGEIEAVLSKNNQVNSTVVLSTDNNYEDKKLIAYIVPKTEIDREKLRDFLKERLPDYMIPSEFIFLSEFPLTINGKLDRKQLLNLKLERNKQENHIFCPKTKVEKQLLFIWETILGEKISINESFFQLGGNSLQAIQIISRIRDTFDINLPVSVILEGTTIIDLAKIIENSKFKKEDVLNWSTLSLKPLSNRQDFPLSILSRKNVAN